ncbi:response regulator [Paenibacillus cymbidii]|uniref:response regulator n=1 Tax=Paenibacillus cymbidii TaxID=1639034 RepID=UPI001080A754|nr:response regulator [Paenibacillus cymbidii]
MYNMLIVDDEPTVRYGLRYYFEWERFGIRIVGEADDGEPALAEIERSRPDIMLTDVRMLDMDGLTLSRIVRERYPDVKIVFISGHDDAEYLKSALQVNAVDYIFKPVNLQELRAVIERVVAELDAKRSEQRLLQDMQQQLKEGMPLLREKQLMALVREGAPKQALLQERIDFLGLSLPVEAAYWVIVVSIDGSAEWNETRSVRDRQLLSYAVQNVCQELIDRYLAGYAFENDSGEFVGILHADAPAQSEESGPEERLLALAGDIRGNLLLWLKLSVTIGIGERADGLAGLAHAYEQGKEAASRKWYLGKNRIITMDSLEQEEEPFRRTDQSLIGRLVSALRAAEEEPLREAADELFADLAQHRRDGFQYARNVCMQALLQAGQLLLELNVRTPGLEEPAAPLWLEADRLETIGELREWLESYLLRAAAHIREKRCGRSSNVVERVRSVIEERYADNGLTVAEIAKAVYLTDTYVSLLFKQETGRTVNEYVTQVRIDKAKELLRDPRYKFYDICYAVGYADPSYFSKLFKKMTGYTPSAFRDQLP